MESPMNILDFPCELLEYIFTCLPYSEVANLRLVCLSFRDIANRLLNLAFLSLMKRIGDMITWLESNSKSCKDTEDVLDHMFRRKVLKALQSEASLLLTTCGRYVATGKCPFAAGAILDYFQTALRKDNLRERIHSDVVIAVYLLCEKFMNYFEESLEPLYLPLTRFGTEIVDILNCYLDSNYNLTVWYDGTTCRVTGIYETVDAGIYSSILPPVISGANGEPTASGLNELIVFLRNNARRKNIRDCIRTFLYDRWAVENKSRQNGGLEVDRKSSLQTVQQKTYNTTPDEYLEVFERGAPPGFTEGESPPELSVYIDLQCSKDMIPVRFRPHLAAFEAQRKNSTGPCKEHAEVKNEFSMKLRHNGIGNGFNGTSLTESIIHLFLTEEKSSVVEFRKDVSVNLV